MDLSELVGSMSERKRATLQLTADYLMPARVEAWLKIGIPLVIGRREGYRIWDVDGHELYDVHLNGGTYNLGHRNPEVLASLREGLEWLDAESDAVESDLDVPRITGRVI